MKPASKHFVMKRGSGVFFLSFLVLFLIMVAIACNEGRKADAGDSVLFKNVTLIDGNGGPPLEGVDILIQDDTIAAIAAGQTAAGAKTIDLTGKTIMPSMTSAHVHIGTLKGTDIKAENYTRENILSQLKRYENYGVGNILVMGSDFPLIFETGLRDSSKSGLLPGARLYSAGYGFTAGPGGQPGGPAFSHLFRPISPGQVPAEIDSLAKIHADVVKMWVDDFGGSSEKMDPSIYKAIIEEAHKKGLRVAAHLYYLSDAKDLVANGLDIIAHSIRDTDIYDALLQMMKEKNVLYIPTLSRDEFTFIYGDDPSWINDDFFKASLEPGVYEMITSEGYRENVKKSKGYAINEKGYQTALRNLKKIVDAGILVVLGTDSGATPVRAQGFSEQLELELMVDAGLTPLQAITAATKNGAIALQINNKSGTLEKGKIADFIVLNGNPVEDIRNTRKIQAVYKAGKEVSKGPLAANHMASH